MSTPDGSANPFEYREPLLPDTGRGLAVPRERAQRQAAQVLRRGGFLTVSAPPRSGVTTFLHALRGTLPRNAFLDLANLSFADDPPREAARVLAREAEGALPALRYPAAPESVTDVLAAVAQARAERGETLEPLAVIVDGFDAWSDESSRKLVLALRAAYTESRTRAASGAAFSVVTGSSADLRDLTASGRTSPLNIAQHVFLPDFDEAETAGLLRRGLAGPAQPEEADEWARLAWRWTRGHPALTQMIGYLAFERHRARRPAAEAIRDALPLLRERATDLLGATLGLLGERQELRRSASEVYSGRPVSFDLIHRPIRELLHLGLIRRDERGFSKPRNPLFEELLAPALNLAAPRSSVSLWSPAAGVARLPGTPSVEMMRPAAAVRVDETSAGFPAGAHDSTTDPAPLSQEAGRASPVPGTGGTLPAPLVQPGTILGGCRVVRRIGRGAMAEVYQARHLGLDMDVAIKVLRHTGQDDRRIAQRFLREARAAAQLSHENIVQIRNVGREGDLRYIEMEYIAGGSVAELLGQTPFADPPRAVELLRGAAAGVHAAHAQGIIHRDLKPDNLMLTRDGKIKVVDFGLAAVGALDGSRLTQDGTIVGTPLYMAPEQWEGLAVDERTDLYSLGATFYHLLTSRPPFDGKTIVELVANFTRNKLVPVERLNPAVPRRLSRVVARTLEKNPENRYENMAELLDECAGL